MTSQNLRAKGFQWSDKYKKHCPIELTEQDAIKIDEEGDPFLERQGMYEQMVNEGDWVMMFQNQYLVVLESSVEDDEAF